MTFNYISKIINAFELFSEKIKNRSHTICGLILIKRIKIIKVAAASSPILIVA
jgi:hypothetical protein